MKITIEIAQTATNLNKYTKLNKSLMKKLVSNTLSRFSNLRLVQHFELSILLCDVKEISDLNQKFRTINNATNVLSFPDMELHWKHILELKPDLYYMYLGDIAFCLQVIKEEAIAQTKLFEEHFIHLFVHSLLHLLGFDHINNEDAVAMEQLEVTILKDFNINQPYTYN